MPTILNSQDECAKWCPLSAETEQNLAQNLLDKLKNFGAQPQISLSTMPSINKFRKLGMSFLFLNGILSKCLDTVFNMSTKYLESLNKIGSPVFEKNGNKKMDIHY